MASAGFEGDAVVGQSSDIRLVLMGKTGAGMSATGNTILGREVFRSCVGASSVTRCCQVAVAHRVGRSIQFVDTPGVCEENKEYITNSIALSSPGLHAIFLIIRLDRFTKEDTNTINLVEKWFGRAIYKYIIVIFTGKDALEAEEMELSDFFKTVPGQLIDLLALVNHRYLAVDNRASEKSKLDFTQRLIAMVDGMVQANCGCYYSMTVYRQAQQYLLQRDEEEKQRRESQLKRERDEIEESCKSKYAKVIREQIDKVERLQRDVSGLLQQEQDYSVQYTDRMTHMKLSLYRTRRQHQHEVQSRHEWVNSFSGQGIRNEEQRQSDLADFEGRINQDIRQREGKLRDLHGRMEEERQAEVCEMERRREVRRRLVEEHSMRIDALELARLEEQEVTRLKKLMHAQSESYLQELTDGPVSEKGRRHSCVVS